MQPFAFPPRILKHPAEEGSVIISFLQIRILWHKRSQVSRLRLYSKAVAVSQSKSGSFTPVPLVTELDCLALCLLPLLLIIPWEREMRKYALVQQLQTVIKWKRKLSRRYVLYLRWGNRRQWHYSLLQTSPAWWRQISSFSWLCLQTCKPQHWRAERLCH